MSNEEMFDSFLSIETMEELVKDLAEITEEEVVSGNHPYQATYYNDLVKVFDEVSMEPEDTLVDFGCGLGRVLFYVNSRHYCKTVGIESNDKLYEKLLDNAKGYQSKFYDQETRMKFLKVDATEYEVGAEDNFFYFFNPFSGKIFEEVIKNIIASVKNNPRDINLLIYYPTFEFMRVIRENNVFILKKMIKLSGYKDDPDEKVLVYHMSRYFV